MSNQVFSGVDIVEIDRVARLLEKHPRRFARKIFTEREQQDCAGRAEKFAARFATKEAVKKILTDGWHYLPWKSIELVREVGHAPAVNLYGGANERAAALGISSISVSVSHSGGLAIASVVAIA